MKHLKVLPLALACGLSSSLSLAADSYLEELVITSSRVETPLREVGTSMSVINAEDIKLSGFTSLADILRSQPSIAVSNSGGIGKQSALRIRGEESYRTQVRIDGVEISDPTGTQVTPQIQHLLSSQINRVEILRGPQGLMYGADAGGVINISTKTIDSGTEGSVSLETGRYGTQQISGHFAAAIEKADLYVSYSDLETDGFNTSVKDTAVQDTDGYENTTLHFRGSYAVNEQLSLSLVARDVEGSSEYDNCFSSTPFNCTSGYDESVVRLAADVKGEVLTHSFSVSEADIQRQNFSAGNSTFYTEGTLKRAEYLGSYQLESGRFVYGLDWKEEDIVANSGVASKRDQLGYYAEYQTSIDDLWYITAGVRYDDNSDFGKHTSYRTTLARLVSLDNGATLKYKAAYGTGFRAPSLSEIAYNFGPFAWGPADGLALGEETSKGLDVGVEYHGANGTRFELVYFDQTIEDEIYYDLISYTGYLQAIGESESKGLEFSFDTQLNANLILTANYTYNKTEDFEGENRIRRPKQLGNLGLSYHSDDEALRLSASYRIAKDAENSVFGVGIVPLEDYGVLQLSASYQLLPSTELYGRIENAGNERYEEITGFNVSGSALYAGVRVQF